ncbi:MAG: hypothetical protein VZQ62_00510 [Methanosphaera sp.]|nr:hypothetical protein [Methanosphaera sp.]
MGYSVLCVILAASPRLELGMDGVKDHCVYQFHHDAILGGRKWT